MNEAPTAVRSAYYQGRKDALAAATGNPFPPHTDEYKEYVRGYLSGTYRLVTAEAYNEAVQ